ncbi:MULTISPECIES: hypothetical protein [Saccharothrix]|uniref:hypothetical protein n=1 Tax=Saccharothrix TaxID=2071 RepID=UPI00093D0818|nr:hypothetical protein [Saccharothrix sp. CB00851]OKI34455.1 hypothetical protein A6A25_24560 [Saccharothrix sp. CB00851]
MRVLWATCGLAVAASALIGVLIGVYLDGVKDEQQAETPASTWITDRPSTAGSSTPPPSTITTDAISSPRSSTTTVRTTTTTPPPAAPPPPPETTTEAPRTTTTTTKVKSTEWPCSPINPLPPPHCRD